MATELQLHQITYTSSSRRVDNTIPFLHRPNCVGGTPPFLRSPQRCKPVRWC
ncbi:hypothetical protein H9L39_07680 [Fusarium oxysporum f. sp. albedinis]|nr:hypothetical protein H9L39_07680 [Fusarium oxysporum f. sp. albedinis]